ncbi:MAG: hypothetical protein A2V93_11355 [Ignavibacteria bacterium RBG_16_34_14]|nr:MAG: hypothetical protein A2V93_11355 [Ignavibacteria bacterium RBG_16_34_14]
MGIIDEKVLAVTVIGVLYAITWMMKPQTILRIVINTVLGIVTIIWALDFFGLYPLSKIIPVNFYS